MTATDAEPGAPALTARTIRDHHNDHLAAAVPAMLQGKEKVSSRHMLIEILLFKLGELIIVMLFNLVMLTGSQIKRSGRKWFS